MREELVELVQRCLVSLADEQGLELPNGLSAETALFGPDGVLDSLGLVSLVLAVEEAIEDAHETSVSLADQRALSRTRSPYRTVDSLAEFAAERIGQGG